MRNNLLEVKRSSYMEFGELYFWTVTINQWQNLLMNDIYKNIILSSLQYLWSNGKINVFAFVIMPNHLHLIWKINELNGKETPQGSFLKYTAHEIKKTLKKEDPQSLANYAIDAHNKNYEFWQRDPLAIKLFSKEMAFQKLDYLHYNPTSGKWHLVKEPIEYFYSSARFYEKNITDFPFLTDLRNEF